jgi:tetratricopeptide (TPR) repeat protein
VRLAHLWQMHGTPYWTVLMGDSREYDAWAQRIASGDWTGSGVFYQAPLYPYFVGAVYSLFGRDLVVLRVIQAVLGSLSCLLVAYAAGRLISKRAGLVAGLALAFYAPAIFFDGLIQKSVLDVLFVSAALALIASLDTRPAPRPATWLTLGLATAALALTRENALVLFPVTAGWAWYLLREQPRSAAAAVALLTAGVVAGLAPVAVRNYVVGGGVYLTTSQLGPNFYIGNNPAADGTYRPLRFGRGSAEFERRDATEIAERAEGRRLEPGEVSRYWLGRAADFISSKPWAWLRLMGRKTALLLNREEMLDTESQAAHAEWSWPLAVLQPLTHFGVLVPLAVLGLWATWAERRRLWIMYAMALTYAASTVAFYVFARYRYPLVPILMVFAAAGLADLRGLVPSRAALAAAALAAVAANWPMLSETRMRAITETNLGVALAEGGRAADAQARYRRAMTVDPDYAPAYNNLGVALRSQGDISGSIAVYREGLRHRDDYPDLHYNLGNALSEAGQLPEAEAAFRRAIELEPGSAPAYRNLGNLLAAQGRPADGLDYLRRALTLAPDDVPAAYDLGTLLLEGQRLDEAEKALRLVVQLSPAHAEAHNNLGITLASRGRIEEAAKEFETAVRLKPDMEDAQRNLVQARRALGR